MSKCIFSLGIIDKKLIIPLLEIIIYMIYFIYESFDPSDKINILFFYFGNSIGEMITFYIPYIFKYENNYKTKNKKQKKCTKNNIIDYFFLLLFHLLKTICVIYEFHMDDENTSYICTMEALEIIMMCLATKFFLKYKYYIHHLISLIIIVISSIIMDFLPHLETISIHFLVFFIIYSIVEVSYYCYIKYLIDVKYHSLYNMIFFCGMADFILICCYFSVILIFEIINNNDNLSQTLEKIIIKFFVGTFLAGFIQSILSYQTINLFNPNFIFVCFVIAKIPNILILAINDLLYLVIIIPYTIQIFALFFYVEIFEFNFCGLNKNTKKNILLREKEENNNNDIGKDDIIVELKYGYFIKNKETEIEKDEKNGLLPEKDKNLD